MCLDMGCVQQVSKIFICVVVVKTCIEVDAATAVAMMSICKSDHGSSFGLILRMPVVIGCFES